MTANKFGGECNRTGREAITWSGLLVKSLLLVLLSGTTAITLEHYVGGTTIYSSTLDEPRAVLHEAILRNTPPNGRPWHEVGANGVNTRIGVVYVAEMVRRVSGLSVHRTYFLLGTVGLTLALISLFVYLRSSATIELALVGVLFFSAIQPLTYAFHYFHPWDRPSLIAWIWVVWLIREDKRAWVAVILPFAVLIKWDILLLPALYFAVHARRGAFWRVLTTTAALSAVGVVTYAVARELLPGGSASPFGLPGGTTDMSLQWRVNLRDARELGAYFPPMLGFSMPMIAAAIGFRAGNRFERASFGFGLALLVPMFLLTNFREIRAEMPVLVLLLPLALRGVAMLSDSSTPGRGGLVEAPP